MIKLGWSLMILKFAHWSKSLLNLTTHATLNKHVILNHKAGPPTARPGRCRVWATLLLITFNFVFVKDYSVAKENYKPTHYKQYILTTLNDLDQTYCLVELYSKENSRWDPKARNGSHVGIPQGRSKYLATVDGVKQIQWGVRYIGNRYGWIDKDNGLPNACNALKHFKAKGWH